jgi:phospholipase/carboxylesterase
LLAYLQPWQPRLIVVRQGGEGPPDLMLLHGEQATPAQLLPSTRSIGFPAQGRILLPEAPEVVAPRDGLPGGRVWWDLDLSAYRRGGRGVDLTSLEPRGLERAAKLVRSSLGRAEISQARPIVLGGFSQGALVACEVAFNSDAPLSALVLLSGTYVDSTEWGWNAAGRRGLPVFIAHGRQDPIFPFEQAEKLAEKLARGQGEGHPGVDVTFVPFEGGHEVTAEVQGELAMFLARLRQAAWRKQAQRGADALAAPASNVKEVRNFPDDLPDCASSASKGTPLEPGLGQVGQRVTFSATLSLRWKSAVSARWRLADPPAAATPAASSSS